MVSVVIPPKIISIVYSVAEWSLISRSDQGFPPPVLQSGVTTETGGINTGGEITGRQSEDGTTSQDIKMRTSRILIIFAFSLATANAIFLEKKLFLINKLKHKLGHKLGHKLDKLGKSGVRLMISHYDDFSRTGT